MGEERRRVERSRIWSLVTYLMPDAGDWQGGFSKLGGLG
jgi:hypothetical protein